MLAIGGAAHAAEIALPPMRAASGRNLVKRVGVGFWGQVIDLEGEILLVKVSHLPYAD
jgi:hypothetical protein